MVEAYQVTMTREVTKDTPDLPAWLSEAMAKKWTEAGAVYWLGGNLFVQTPGGTVEVALYDWIVRGSQGELFPVKPDTLEALCAPAAAAAENPAVHLDPAAAPQRSQFGSCEKMPDGSIRGWKTEFVRADIADRTQRERDEAYRALVDIRDAGRSMLRQTEASERAQAALDAISEMSVPSRCPAHGDAAGTAEDPV